MRVRAYSLLRCSRGTLCGRRCSFLRPLTECVKVDTVAVFAITTVAGPTWGHLKTIPTMLAHDAVGGVYQWPAFVPAHWADSHLLTPRNSAVVHCVKKIPVVPFDINGGVFVEALKAGDKVADRPSAFYFAYVACLTPRSDKDGGGGVHSFAPAENPQIENPSIAGIKNNLARE